MKILKFPLILFWLAVMPAAYAQAKGVVEGRLINRTDSSIVARGVDLEVMGLGGSMSTIRTAITDPAGRFRIEGLPENLELVIRANYKGANYHGQVRFNPAGEAFVEIEVYESTDSMKDIQVEGAQLVFEMAGDQLKAVQTVIFNNKTNPPRTYINPKGSFRFSKPPGLLKPPLMSVTASGSSMPLVQPAKESADGQSYYSLYPLRPGVSTFEVQEVLPYTNQSYTYGGRFYQDVDSLKIGVIPHDLAVSGKGLSKRETNVQKNFTVYATPPVKAGAELAWTFSGGTPVSESESQEAAGDSTIQTVPTEIMRNALIIGPLLLMAFVLALWHAFNRSQNESQPVVNLHTRPLNERRDRLLNSIAEIDHRYETHSGGRQEFLKQRAKYKRELHQISLLLKKK
jgi:hypothetical protein